MTMFGSQRIGAASRRPHRERGDAKLLRLRACHSLDTATDRQLRDIAALGEVTTVPRGEVLATVGARPRWVYLILEGDVLVTGARVTRLVNSGYVGELAAFAGCASPFTARAVGGVEALVFDARDYVRLVDEAPAVRDALRLALSALLSSQV